MKALVTGGAGFIGSHLVDALIERGWEVDIIDNLSTGRMENVNSVAHLDICSIQDVDEGGWGPYDAVFHLAARARIQPSIEDPFGYALANDLGTVAALEIARKFNAHFVFASSSSVYGSPEKMPLKMEQLMDPLNPYAMTKAVGELWCKLYCDLYGLRVTVLRFFNVFGERQIPGGPYSTVIGVFDKQKEEGVPLTIVGDGTQTRAFTYVKDVVAACLLSVDATMLGGFNVGGPREVSVNEIADAIAGPDYPRSTITRKAEAKRTLADTAPIRKLGWEPKVDVIEWIKSRV